MAIKELATKNRRRLYVREKSLNDCLEKDRLAGSFPEKGAIITSVEIARIVREEKRKMHIKRDGDLVIQSPGGTNILLLESTHNLRSYGVYLAYGSETRPAFSSGFSVINAQRNNETIRIQSVLSGQASSRIYTNGFMPPDSPDEDKAVIMKMVEMFGLKIKRKR